MLIPANMATNAVPADPSPKEATQADGTVITYFLRGDEFFSWCEDAEGYVIEYDEASRNWCYAFVYGGSIVPGTQIVGTDMEYSRRITSDDLLPLITLAHDRISLNKASITLTAGKTESLDDLLAYRPGALSVKPIVTWSTSNSAVASVSDGVLAAVAPGNAIITATTELGSTAACTVKVVAKSDDNDSNKNDRPAVKPQQPELPPDTAPPSDTALPPDPASAPVLSITGMNMVLDGKLLTFEVQPRIVNGRTLVPLRALSEALGAAVYWDADTKTATVLNASTEIVLTIGDFAPTVNGLTVAIDQPGIIENGRTLVPLRFIAEAFGITVNWTAT